MVAATMLLVVIAVLVAVAVAVAFAVLVRRQRRTDEHLNEPDVPTVLYVVPDGADPAVVSSYLDLAGFANAFERHGGLRCLRIECAPGNRERLRALIEDAYLTDEEHPVPAVAVRFSDEA